MDDVTVYRSDECALAVADQHTDILPDRLANAIANSGPDDSRAISNPDFESDARTSCHDFSPHFGRLLQ